MTTHDNAEISPLQLFQLSKQPSGKVWKRSRATKTLNTQILQHNATILFLGSLLMLSSFSIATVKPSSRTIVALESIEELNVAYTNQSLQPGYENIAKYTPSSPGKPPTRPTTA